MSLPLVFDALSPDGTGDNPGDGALFTGLLTTGLGGSIAGSARIILTAFPPPLALGLGTLDGYQFSRATVSGGPYTVLGSSTTNTYGDTTAAAGVLYYYVCQGYSGSLVSGYSQEAAAFFPVDAPAPTVLATPGNGRMLLRWSAPPAFPYGSLSPGGYLGVSLTASVYRSLSPGGEGGTPVASGIASTFWIDRGLINGLTYYYRVALINEAGSSPQSVEVSAVPQIGLIF